jgi:hypothetical protein
MKEVERGMVFQNLTEQAELLYVEVQKIEDYKFSIESANRNQTNQITKTGFSIIYHLSIIIVHSATLLVACRLLRCPGTLFSTQTSCHKSSHILLSHQK